MNKFYYMEKTCTRCKKIKKNFVVKYIINLSKSKY